MAPAAVVEPLDVLEDRVGELDPRAPPLPVEQLDLHASPERLDDRVVVGIPVRTGSPPRPVPGRMPSPRPFGYRARSADPECNSVIGFTVRCPAASYL